MAGILADFDAVDEALETMEGAAGSADKEMEIIRDSIEYKLNAIKQQWVSTLTDIAGRDEIKGVLDFVLKLSEGLGGIISDLGLFKTTLIGIGTVVGSQKLGLFGFNTETGKFEFGDRSNPHSLGGLLAISSDAASDAESLQRQKDALQSIRDLYAAHTEEDNILFDTDASLEEAEKFKECFSDLTDESQKFVESLADDAAEKTLEALDTKIADTGTQLETATQKSHGFRNAVGNLGKSLLNTFASAALSAGISFLISAVGGALVSAFDNWRHRVENAKKAIKDSIDVYETSKGEIESLNKELETTQTRMDELLAKDSLTIVEQDELETLKKTNDELERQIDLKKRQNEIDARNMLDTIAAEKDTVLTDVRYLQDHGYDAYTAVRTNNDVGVMVEKTNIDNVLEFNEALKAEEAELDRINTLLRQGTIAEVYENGAYVYKLTGPLTEEFDSYTQFVEYQNALEQNIARMKKDSEDRVYDLKSDLLQINQWLDNFDEVGYENLKPSQKDAYDSLVETKEWLQEQVYNDSELFTIKLKVDVESESLQKNLKKIHSKLFDSGIFDAIGEDEQKRIEEWIKGLSEEEAQAIADSTDKILPALIGDLAEYLSASQIENIINSYRAELGRGGKVNLNNRPELSTQFLAEKGWDVPTGWDEDGNLNYATIHSRTFSDPDETRFINFTPIIIDPETGEFKGVLTDDELTEYAESVIAGTRKDDLNLQIGAEFTSVDEAVDAAIAAHSMDEMLHDLRSGKLKTADSTSTNWVERLANSIQNPINALEKLKDVANETANSLDRTKDEVQELQDVADETKAVDSMAKMETALASLGDLYDQVIEKPKDASEDTLFGFADPSTINSIESAFEGLIETIDDDDAKQKLSYALRDFETTLVEFPGDEERAQQAMNKLLTAYMDQVYGLDNVTEANKEWTIALLKNKGAINAEEVVESRLDKTNKRLLASEKKLSAVFRDNETALDDINRGTDEHEKALQSLADEINSMFSFSENGTDFNLNIDTNFVAENLDLIRRVAAGDAEAIIELQNLLRMKMVANIGINTDVPQVVDMIRNDLTDLSKIDLSNIEVGMDITQADSSIQYLIDRFQSWVDAGLMSVEEVNNAFASIGAEPDATETKPVKMNVSSATKVWGLSGSGAAAAQQSMGSATEIVVNMPILKYKKLNNGAWSKGLKNINYKKPTTKDKGDTGSGDKGGSEEKVNEDTEESFDWIEVRLKRLQEAYARLDKVTGAVYETWIDRNDALNDSIKITKEQLDAAKAAAESYKNHRDEVQIAQLKDEDYDENSKKQREYDEKQRAEAEKIWKSGKYQKLIQEGKIGKDDIEKISNHWLTDAMNQFIELNDKYISADDSYRDYLDQYYNDHQEIFDNIKSEFEGILGLWDAEGDAIDKLIERTEEHGYFVSEKYYDKKKALVQDRIDAETQKLHDLTKARDEAVASGAIQEGGEAWVNMTKDIEDAKNEINGYYTELIKLDNEQRQLRWDGFDYAIEKLDKMNEETEFLIDLLDNKDLFNFEYDERGHKTYDGTMSDRGWAAAGLHASQYNKELLKSKYAAEQLAEVEEQLATEKGKNDKNLIARREEMLELQRSSIQAAEQEKEAIKDLVEEGVNKHLDALQELIDKYKESLSDAKDLYEYQKSIASQTKQISSLQKQLSAYSGDDSEEARAKRQQLSESLKEAETNLKETEWDRYISETNDMLDQMFDEYSDVLNQRLDDVDALMVYMTDQINARSGEIQTTIEDVAKDYAYKTTPEFQRMFEGNGELISTFSGNFDEFSSNVIDALDTLVQNTLELTKGDNVMKQVESEGLTGQAHKSKKGYWYENADGSYAKNEYRNGYWYDKNGYWNGTEKKATWKQNDKGWWYQYGNGKYPKNQWLKIDGEWYYFDENGYMVTGERMINGEKHFFTNSGKWTKNYGKKAYATGSSHIPYDQLAWTQEQGSELIFRASDGAMLTPLNKGDMVFTNDMTKNLWDLAKNPALTGATVKLPESALTARTVNNENAITVVLPNVQSYDDFKQALMKDKQITNFMQSVTIGQALGKGKLNRGNM